MSALKVAFFAKEKVNFLKLKFKIIEKIFCSAFLEFNHYVNLCIIFICYYTSQFNKKIDRCS